MRSDRRVLYTQRAIREAFLSLLETTPMEEITVKEICSIADINRATFYRNYADLYALFDSIEEELLRTAFPDRMHFFNILEFLMLIREHRAFYREVYRRNKASRCSMDIIERFKSEKFAQHHLSCPKEEYDARLRYAVYGVGGMIRDWLESGCQEDPVKVSEWVEGITDRLLCCEDK